MTIHQIVDLLGPGFRREVYTAEHIILYEWPALGVWVSLDLGTRALRVISVFGTNTRYRTDKGVTLLHPFARAEAAYGEAYSRWEFREEKIILVRYTGIGLQFGVVNDPAQKLLHGRIFQIGIFKPGDLPPARQP